MQPLLSIVIANYNYGRFLEEAIQSVLSQSCDDYELIIVDGGSTDNSVEIIKKYEDKIAWWVSEKDKGQSDAFNKGFAHANGKYLTWLNADDILVDGCLGKVVVELQKYPECEWFTGNFFRFLDNGQIMEINWGPHYYPKFLQRRTSPIVVFGPSTFFAKSLWERAGRIDERFHLAMDTELWARFITMGITQRRINVFVWAFRMHERSKTAEFGNHCLSDEHQERFRIEDSMIYEKTKYRTSSIMHFLILCWRVFDGSIFKRYLLRLSVKKINFSHK